jgi:hypothetical protein
MNNKNIIPCPCREGQQDCLECGGKGWVRIEDTNAPMIARLEVLEWFTVIVVVVSIIVLVVLYAK